MIKQTSEEITYKEIRKTFYLDINGKEVKVYTYDKQDNDLQNYDSDCEVDKEDEKKLTEDESEELETYLGDEIL
ncbi:MAG: hypothetical protein WC781_05710 [Candidatus Pacearchaeota archaeon]|jgi:hypothetical protein